MPWKPRSRRFSTVGTSLAAGDFPGNESKNLYKNSRFDKNFIKGAFLFIVLFRGKTIIRSSNENKRKYGRACRRVCEARLVGRGNQYVLRKW